MYIFLVKIIMIIFRSRNETNQAGLKSDPDNIKGVEVTSIQVIIIKFTVDFAQKEELYCYTYN